MTRMVMKCFVLGLALAALLLQGCISTGPPGNAHFADINNVEQLAGVYRNLGEQRKDAPPVYLSAQIWPERKDHSAITTIEVEALDSKTLLVKAHGKDGVVKEETFVAGKDFEIRDGRVRLKEAVGFAGLIETQAHAMGPTYERDEIGVDRRGHGKLSKRTGFVGLFMMVPVAFGVREDVRFRRVDR